MQVLVPIPNRRTPPPDVGRYLATAPDAILQYRERGYRHPAGAWNSGFQNAILRLESATKQFELVIAESLIVQEVGASYAMLLERLQAMYFELATFEDICQDIVLSIVEHQQPRKDELFRDFGNRKKAMSDRLGRVTNSIKHRAGRLRPLLASGRVRGRFFVVPCVYVESFDPGKNALGPDSAVHDGGNSAFSIARQLRYYFVHLYFLSGWIKECLIRRCGKHMAPPKPVEAEAEHLPVEYLSRTLSNAPRVVMPNEFHLAQPDVRFGIGSTGATMILSLVPDSQFLPIETMRIMSTAMGDGHTRSFVLPYAGQDAAKDWPSPRARR